MVEKKKYVIASAPYRISLGGGGTDLPFYASKNNGHLITAAIDENITIMVAHRKLDNKIFLQYSEVEVVENMKDVSHQILREVLKYYKINDSFQIATFSTMPTFTGLGASSTLIVALIKAITSLFNIKMSNLKIAEEAFHIEREILGLDGGCQDQYISSLGGIQSMSIKKDLSVKCSEIKLNHKLISKLENCLFLIHSTVDRRSEDIINNQVERVKFDQSQIFRAYDKIKEIGIKALGQIKEGKISELGLGMDEHWKVKKSISDTISSSYLDSMYSKLKSFGALGGKIVGAGGGGFFLMVVDKDHDQFRKKVVHEGHKILDFKIDFKGVNLLT